MVLTIVWDLAEFAVATALDTWCKFNAGHYVSEVLTPLSEWWRERGCGNFGKLIVYADNAHPHKGTVSQQFMAGNAMLITAHPPYSPDLAPSDFYLLGDVKGLPRGKSFEAGQRLLSAVERFRVVRKVDFDEGFSRVDEETRAIY
jgi:histone-lysine N-methyltransferase SETMAR